MERDDINNIVNNTARLQWACRRGMLELDVLLGNFLKEAYSQLLLEDKKLFVELLGCTDPELFAWLMGYKTPSDEGLARIINVLRCHAQSRI